MTYENSWQDDSLKLEWVPDWVAIIGSGYIGLEFSDVYTALGSEVTFIEAMDNLMPTFDPDIRRVADRILIQPRKVDGYTSVFATEVLPGEPGKKPVKIKLVDAKTKEEIPDSPLYVDAALVCTGRVPNTQGLQLDKQGIETVRGFVQVNEKMQVLDKAGGKVVPNLYCIGDANGKMMLAHAASAQGISAVENIVGREHAVDHNAVPAACFTHPEIAMVGLTEEQAKANLQGGHLPYVRLVVDEASQVRAAAFGARHNLSIGTRDFKFVGMCNPDDLGDIACRHSVPSVAEVPDAKYRSATILTALVTGSTSGFIRSKISRE